jgi:osmotically-inducible protein OsmY
MSWLGRLFGLEKPETAPPVVAPTTAAPSVTAATAAKVEAIPLERLGLRGEYDQNGLAKRVAAAFDDDDAIDDITTLFVAQTGGTVVLKGKVPNQAILNKIVLVAGKVLGATSVDSSHVEVHP